jgi:hypothetical protein
MSKIALTPNAAGTGVFTISSPATSTDRTLTLPDITGTLVSTDASGNVGIGTSSPDALLDVSRSGNGQIAVLQTSANRGFSFESQSDTALQIASVQGSTNLDLWANTLTFSAGATERMRIDSSGNVGIGVTPSAWGAVIRALQVNETGMSLFTYTAAGTVDQYAFLTNNSYQDSGYADTYVRTNPAAQYRQLNNIHAWYNAPSGTAGTAITFTQAMTLDASGNLLVGTTVARTGTASITIEGGNSYQQFRAAGTGSLQQVSFVRNTAVTPAEVGYISTTGTATTYATSSDYRLKTDAQPMVGASARVLALKPVNFEWISDGSRVDGFLAHEAQEIVPECVTGTKDAMRDEQYEVTAAIEATYDEDGNELTAAVEAVMGTRSVPDMQGIDQSKLVPLLTAALQEALTEISALKVRVAALEAV